MDKEKLLAALNAIQNGDREAGAYLETLITLVIDARDEDIAAAWEDFHTDTDTEASAKTE